MTPASDISPTTSLGCGSLIGGALDCVLGTVGLMAAIFATKGCGLAVVFSVVDGCGSLAACFSVGFVGFPSFVDATVRFGCRGLCRVCGVGGVSGSEVSEVSEVVAFSSDGPV